MKLPRDLSGEELAGLLSRHYGYRIARMRGSHVRMILTIGENRHSATVRRHRDLRVGTLDGIIADVAAFLGQSKDQVRHTLFG